ncbi:phospholipase A1 VesT1.02 isoform X2 [Manduca sexta]|uniref:phospholipase A1 VesT1.02 isoform X2 n=1 Tax=Manduca sexta TaxID=7130 RepID=UPI001890656D|nr:phospholipase A1 VesT1.02 isoform X2 [Manduca sexta]
MQEKNASVHETLNIDLITKNGNVKFNLTATKRLGRVMKNAKTIIILIHGFLESSDGWMVSGLAPVLLNRTGLKLFALDGRKIINWEYFRSSTYARFMGEQLGTSLSKIIKDGQDPTKISLIGHSLGAHIAGVTGKRVHQLTGQLLSRITALDPAGPCFSSVDSGSRIERTDAKYVNVIHTNGGVLGLKEPVIWIFIPMAVCLNLVVFFLRVIIVGHGSISLNLSVHRNTFQLADVTTGRCSKMVCAQKTKFLTWVFPPMETLDCTSLQLVPHHHMASELLAVDELNILFILPF